MKKIPNPARNKSFVIWLVFIVLAVGFFKFYEKANKKLVKDFNYPKFLQAVEKNQVKKDSIVFNEIAKEIKGELNTEGQRELGGKSFLIQGNVSDKGFEILEKQGITPSYANKDKTLWMTVFLSLLPLFLILGIFIFFIKQIQAGSGKAFSFGKSRSFGFR